LEGVLLAAVEVGESIRVHRKFRNGIKVDGVFVSSPVLDVHGNRVTTLSSIYQIDVLADGGAPPQSGPFDSRSGLSYDDENKN
jgi:hypothetical protein